MKLLVDFPEKDYKFIRDTYKEKETGLSFIPPVIKYECIEAVYNGTPYVKPETGKWVRKDSNTFMCPICGNFLNFRGVNAGRGDAHYCPNCGTELEREDKVD